MCKNCRKLKTIEQVRRDLKKRGWFPKEIKNELARLRAEIETKSQNSL